MRTRFREAELVLWLAVACGGKSTEERAFIASSGGHAAGGGAGENVGGTNAGGVPGGMGGTAGGGAGTAGSGGRLIPQRPCYAYEFPCREGDQCACRDDPRPECQTTRTCHEDNQWTLEPGTCVAPPKPVACPATPALGGNMPCTSLGMVCDYPGERICVCLVPFDVDAHPCRISNGPDGPLVKLWDCGEGPEGCLDGIPAIGSACTQEGLSCGNPCANEHAQYARVCRDGVWERRYPETECL